jgi:hypothetical protein
VTYQANADAWFMQNSPTNNYGSDSNLKVQGKNNDSYRAAVRFNLPASVPTGCTVQSATLRLNASSASNNRTLQAFRLNGSWTESGITWRNQPATTGTAATVTSGNGWREWNVTGQVQAIFASGANNGFLIRDASESGGGAEQQFRSREAGNNRPVLVVTYAQASTTSSGGMASANTASLAAMPVDETGRAGAVAGAAPSRTAARIELSDLSGPAGVISAAAVDLRVLGGEGGAQVRVTLREGVTAPAGRYTGTVTITWRDNTTRARVTEEIPVELSVGMVRVYLPLVSR